MAAAQSHGDSVGEAMPHDPLPTSIEFEAWDRYRRDTLNWDILARAFLPHRFDIDIAAKVGASKAKSTVVRLNDGHYQSPASYFTDRAFAPSYGVVTFIT